MILTDIDTVSRAIESLDGGQTALAWINALNDDTAFSENPFSEKAFSGKIQIFRTTEKTPGQLEYHRRHIDIYYMLSGEETVLVGTGKIKSTGEEYAECDDVGFISAEEDGYRSYALHKGNVMILFPGEAHYAGGVVSECGTVKKTVIKVNINAEKRSEGALLECSGRNDNG